MDPSTQENQHEFFPDFVKPSERKAESRVAGIGRTQKPILFTTTIEQLLFTAIVAILVLCAVYFLGILRGKSLDHQPPALAPRTTAQPRVAAPSRTAIRSTTANIPLPPAATVSAPVLPAPQRTTAAQAPVPGGRLYTIQVVTHKKRSFAESELAAIGKAGFSGRILESDGYFVVCVGQYAAKNDAKRDLGLLKAKYSDCFLRRL